MWDKQVGNDDDDDIEVTEGDIYKALNNLNVKNDPAPMKFTLKF